MTQKETERWQMLYVTINRLIGNTSDTPVTHAELSELLTSLYQVLQDMHPDFRVED